MINYPPKPWYDGQTFKYTAADGAEVFGTYSTSKNAWTFARISDTDPSSGFVTTADVKTTTDEPRTPDDWDGLNNQYDVLDLDDQKQVNWFLAEQVVKNKDDLEHHLWVGPNPPVIEEGEYEFTFWWDTNALELLFNNNGMWFPVSIPPEQIESLASVFAELPDDPSVGQEWTNENTGVTYKYDGKRWYIVSTSESDLEKTFATIEYSDAEDAKLQSQIDDLIPEVEKEPLDSTRLYKFKRSGITSQGEFVSTVLSPTSVTQFFFDVKDVSGQTVPSVSPDDLVTVSTSNYKTVYKVTSSSPGDYGSSVFVEYKEGSTENLVENQRYTVVFSIFPAGLTNRISEGEQRQSEIIETISEALEVQGDLVVNLDTLENKVEALEGTVIDGNWYAESRSTPREGGFDITSGGLQSMGDWNADYIRIHKTDNTGKVFTFGEISIGDYIRIGAPGSNCVYKITEIPTGSLDWQSLGVELTRSTGTPIPELVYDFEFLPSFDPSAYATIDYVDNQDNTKVNLTGENIITTPWRIKSNDKSFISVTTNEMKLYHIADPTGESSTWAANKGYVDTESAKKVSKVGDQMSGRLDITMANEGTAAIRTIGQINVKKPGEELGGANNFSAGPSYVRVFTTPSSPNDVVTKEFLDTELANVAAPDLSNYATRSFAEDLTYRPARLRWLYQGKDLGSSAPPDQNFKFDGDFIRLSFKTFNGVDLGVSKVPDTGAVSFTNGPVGMIWYKDANFKWKMKQQFRLNAWRWNYNGHFELKRSSRHGNDDNGFTVDATYYITVGGFF